jgi:hypothetical protein
MLLPSERTTDRIKTKKKVNLMTGINILAEYTAGGVPVWLIAVGLFTLFAGLILLLCGLASVNEKVAAAGGVVLFLNFALAVGVEVFGDFPHTRYKVTISEDVKLIEFLERYEIIDTEGEIYTIREVIPDA